MEFFAAVDFTPQRVSLILMLVAFIATFLITRGITRKIRSERLAEDGAPPDDVADAEGGRKVIQDIEIGGVHIHHQVWGLLLMLVSGMLQFAFEPFPQVAAGNILAVLAGQRRTVDGEFHRQRGLVHLHAFQFVQLLDQALRKGRLVLLGPELVDQHLRVLDVFLLVFGRLLLPCALVFAPNLIG